VCTGARNESSKALSSSAVPLGSPRSSTSLPAHCKFNARALRPAHASSQCLGVSGREGEGGGRARARERRVREREGEGGRESQRERGGREGETGSEELFVSFSLFVSLSYDMHVSSSSVFHCVCPSHMTCMYPSPHMTCMYPPPLFFTVCVPLSKQNERVSGTCRPCNREHILSLQ
jgi:hypothetical protein